MEEKEFIFEPFNTTLITSYKIKQVTQEGILEILFSHNLRLPTPENQTEIIQMCFNFLVFPNHHYDTNMMDWKEFDKKVNIEGRNLVIKNSTLLIAEFNKMIFKIDFNKSDDISSGGSKFPDSIIAKFN